MSLPQLRNMVLCAEAGRDDLPAMPAFYQMPKTLDDLADFMAGKILSRARLLARALSVMEGMSAPVRSRRRRQDPGAHRRDVRRDRAALRPAQSRAQRRARSRAGATARSMRWRSPPGARVLDLCTGTGDLAVATVRAQPRRLGGRRRLRRRDAAARPRQGARARLGRARSGSCAATRRGSRSRDASLRRRDHRLRHPQRRRARAGARRDRARAQAGRPARDSRVRPAAAFPGIRTLYAWYFRYLLPLVGRLVSKHQSAYSYLPASVGTFPPPAEFAATIACHRIFTASGPSL